MSEEQQPGVKGKKGKEEKSKGKTKVRKSAQEGQEDAGSHELEIGRRWDLLCDAQEAQRPCSVTYHQ